MKKLGHRFRLISVDDGGFPRVFSCFLAVLNPRLAGGAGRVVLRGDQKNPGQSTCTDAPDPGVRIVGKNSGRRCPIPSDYLSLSVPLV